MARALKKFTELIDRLLRVPHSEIKAALDAKKAAKKKEKLKGVQRDE